MLNIKIHVEFSDNKKNWSLICVSHKIIIVFKSHVTTVNWILYKSLSNGATTQFHQYNNNKVLDNKISKIILKSKYRKALAGKAG